MRLLIALVALCALAGCATLCTTVPIPVVCPTTTTTLPPTPAPAP